MSGGPAGRRAGPGGRGGPGPGDTCPAGIFCRRGLFGSNVIIRTALPSEFTDIGDIRVAAYQADGFLSAASRYASTLRRLGTVGDGDILVAAEDGQLLGTIMLQHWPAAGEVVRGPDEAEIRALAVAPAERRKGTGSALVRAVIDRAASGGVRHLVLCTMTTMRTAHRLYEQAGFSRLPERDWSPEPGVTLLAYGLVLPDQP
jgi:ribosomal protein S18 acetylase RimI-like enzyme